MTCREPHPHPGGFLCHQPQQLREVSLPTKITVHVLPQECHLLESALLQVSHLLEDALHAAASLAPPGIGDDAVVAEVVTAAHDAYIAADLVTQADPLGYDVLIRLRRRQFDVHRLMPRLGLCDKVRKAQVGVGPCHEVAVVLFQQFGLHPLCHASQHPYDQRIPVFSSLFAHSLPPLCRQGLQPVVDLLLGIVSHAAGVQEDDACLVKAFGSFIAGHAHHAGHHLRVCHIHLAAVGLYIQFLHFGCEITQFP